MADSNFDVEEYAGRYSGHNRINRLLFVAQQTMSREVAERAIGLANAAIKSTENTVKYAEMIKIANASKAQSVTGMESSNGTFVADAAWVSSTEKATDGKIRRVQDALNSARTELMKESTRKGHNDLGDQFYACGQLQNALKSYVRSKDFCAQQEHHLEMFLNVIRVSTEIGQFSSAGSYALRAEQTLGTKTTNLELLGKVKAAHGLVLLCMGSYREAADRFVTVDQEMGNSFTDVVAPEDVALYGALSALASYTRLEIREKVLDNAAFKTYLDMLPELRDMLQHFITFKYGEGLALLSQVCEKGRLDQRLASHVNKLYATIRDGSLIQYCNPFSTVMLDGMAKVFNMPLAELETELARLIGEQAVHARIDSYNKVLIARESNERKVAYSKALEVGKEYQEETQAMLLRLFLLRSNMIHKKDSSRPGMMRGPSEDMELP